MMALSRPRPLVVMLALTCALAACKRAPTTQPPPPPPPKGQTLRALSFQGAFATNTISRFEQATSSKVELREYKTNDELLGMLARDVPADLIFPSSPAVEYLLRNGRLKPLAQDRVPHLSEVPVEFRSPPYDPGLRYCAPYDFWLVGMAVVPSQQGLQREPDALATLFAPEGPEVAWLDDMRSTLGMALRYLERSASSQQVADLAQVRELLIKAAPRVVELTADPGPLLRTGRVKLALGRSTDVIRMASERTNVRFVVPREGALLNVDYACVPTGAAQPELAFALIDHLLSPEVAMDIGRERLLPRLSLSAKRTQGADAREQWAVLETVRQRNQGFEPVRDVGSALPAYELTWKAVREAVDRAREQRAAAASQAPKPHDGKPEPRRPGR
jgi:spermidine/putrescine transport system substrate-binding protein